MMSMRGQACEAINILTWINWEKTMTDLGKARFQTAAQIVGESQNYTFKLRVAELGVKVGEIEAARVLFAQVEKRAQDRAFKDMRDIIRCDLVKKYMSLDWIDDAIRVIDQIEVNCLDKRNLVRLIAYHLQFHGQSERAEQLFRQHGVTDLSKTQNQG